MEVSRRKFLRYTAGATAAAVVGVPLSAVTRRASAATTFHYKFASNSQPTHPLTLRMKAAAKAIEEETHGAFKLSIFPNGQLGSDTQMLNQLRAGAIQFFTLSGLILQTLVPEAGINGIGFAFPDYATVWKAMDGNLGAFIRSHIKAKGLYVMDKIFDNGFREVTTSTHPIVTPADFHNLKIRVPVSPLWTSMFKDLGAAPISLNWDQVYTALQTKLADAEENPLSVIELGKLYEVQKYCSMTNHMWDGFWFLGNQAAWDRVPKDIQAVVAKHVNAAAVLERADIAHLNNTLKTKLVKQGMKFNHPDPKPIRVVLQKSGFYADWKKKFGAKGWSILEEYAGSLG